MRAIDIDTGSEIAAEELSGNGVPIEYFELGPNNIIMGGGGWGCWDYSFNLKFTIEDVQPGQQDNPAFLSDSGFYVNYGTDSGDRLEKFSYDGEQVWRREWPNIPRTYIPSMDDNSVYILQKWRLSALNRSNGKRRWQYELERKTDLPPQNAIPVNDQVIIGSKDRLVAVG